MINFTQKKKRGRKPVLTIGFIERPWEETDKAFMAGQIMGTLHKHGRFVESDEFYKAINIGVDGRVGVSAWAMMNEACKYLSIKIKP